MKNIMSLICLSLLICACQKESILENGWRGKYSGTVETLENKWYCPPDAMNMDDCCFCDSTYTYSDAEVRLKTQDDVLTLVSDTEWLNAEIDMANNIPSVGNDCYYGDICIRTSLDNNPYTFYWISVTFYEDSDDILISYSNMRYYNYDGVKHEFTGKK